MFPKNNHVLGIGWCILEPVHWILVRDFDPWPCGYGSNETTRIWTAGFVVDLPFSGVAIFGCPFLGAHFWGDGGAG